jgi:hypothetical protein
LDVEPDGAVGDRGLVLVHELHPYLFGAVSVRDHGVDEVLDGVGGGGAAWEWFSGTGLRAVQGGSDGSPGDLMPSDQCSHRQPLGFGVVSDALVKLGLVDAFRLVGRARLAATPRRGGIGEDTLQGFRRAPGHGGEAFELGLSEPVR